jgi:hypothetical protein
VEESLLMPRTVKVDTQCRLVISCYSGELTISQVLRQWEEIAAHPDFDSSFSYLTDTSDITDYLITPSDARHLARTVDPFDRYSQRIVVAPSDLIFGMARMYGMAGEQRHPNLAVVRTIEDAYTLLSELSIFRLAVK